MTAAVAVIADAHVIDPAQPQGGPGVAAADGRRLWLRPWADAARTPRAVNESLWAFEATLARIAARGIRHVVLLGDTTDDGQALATAALAERLAQWETRAGLRFLCLPGNHDMWAVAGKHVATRLAAPGGAMLTATSDPSLAGREPGAALVPGLRTMGQESALRAMAAFGYVPRDGELHWETPFGTSHDWSARSYLVRAGDGSVAHRLICASYLVEPLPGLWLMMLDANVWAPCPGIADPARKRAWAGPETTGWDALARLKPHLPPWIADVAARARAAGKALVALSHYPAVGAGVGPDTGDTPARRPGPAAAAPLVRAGVALHLCGHLHRPGRAAGPGGLTEVSVPSPVAWPPGYAEIALRDGRAEARLHGLDDLPADAELAALMRAAGAPEGDPAVAEGTGWGAILRARAGRG